MGFNEAGSWQAGHSMLRTSSQDDGFRLEINTVAVFEIKLLLCERRLFVHVLLNI